MMTPSIVVEVNRAVAIGMARSLQEGLKLLLQLEDQADNFYPYHAARADLLRRTNQREAAANCFAVSTGVSLPPIVFTHAEPTMTPSASAPTCLACSGVLIPNLKLWIEYQGDMDVAEVETTHILAYLNFLRTDYVPHCITGNNDKKLSPKTVYNLYFSVASFFTWALCRR